MISSDETDIPQLEYINTHAQQAARTQRRTVPLNMRAATRPVAAVRLYGGIAIDLRVDGVCISLARPKNPVKPKSGPLSVVIMDIVVILRCD